jgi:superfamily II DNA or RNA helicase
MLGLSATPNRKDGLTKVLKWFIGDIIFQRKGKSAVNSIVERYVYDCGDEEYAVELSGYMGKLNSAGMINNIAFYQPRTEFIIKKVVECVEEERQILILSDRKEMLKDLENMLNERKISNGYYIGGMKQASLEESSKKTVILATFQMAAEGLDIATIDTIILGTPKTDIEQAVGRIRPKVGVVAKNSPLVIDIVDDFSMFGRQADKRYSFYKKKNYFIETFRVSRDGNTIVKTDTWEPNDDEEPKKKTGKVQTVLKKFAFV